MSDRFAFGENWDRYLSKLFIESAQSESPRIGAAIAALKELVGDITGKRFLDIGSGSGLFSLAANRLGARVHSFDYDRESVQCTRSLKGGLGQRGEWVIDQGDVLDREYIAKLGQFDVVYSWGVLHHTGNLWQACEHAASLVAPRGTLVIALYNDQGWKSRYWHEVKRMYVTTPLARPVMALIHLPLLLVRVAARAITGRLTIERGMSYWRDYIDWIGGYPFEVASVEAVQAFFTARGFKLVQLKDVGDRSGCNEFVFTDTSK